MLDGQVKLFSAMLHEEKAVIARHRIPDDTTGATQVRALLEHAGLDNAVVTADAVNAQRDTAACIAGKRKKAAGNRTVSCSSRATSPNSSAPSPTPSSKPAPATPITPN